MIYKNVSLLFAHKKDQIADPNLSYNNIGTVNVNGRLNLENTQEDKMFITYHVFYQQQTPTRGISVVMLVLTKTWQKLGGLSFTYFSKQDSVPC